MSDYSITFPESIWDRVLEKMLASKEPILEMTAKEIIRQMVLEKQLRELRKDLNK